MMKVFLGWLSDPIFHVACIAIVVFQFLHAGEAKDDATASSAACSMCKQVHDRGELCSHFALSTAAE